MHVDQRSSQRRQRAHRDGAPVDARGRTTGPTDFARQGQRLVDFHPVRIQDSDGPTRRRVEHGFYVCMPRARTNIRGMRPAPQHQRHCVDQDRLSRARLPGKHIQPGLQRKIHGIDQRKVANADVPEHGRLSGPVNRSRHLPRNAPAHLLGQRGVEVVALPKSREARQVF